MKYPSSAQEMIGFSKAKRAVALDLGVDPYSSNEALQKFGRTSPTGILVALSGDATPLAKQKLKDIGVEFVTRLSPGPLK
jgi:hypothetical protein